MLRSREISRELSICQTRLNWWKQTLVDVENERVAREPLARMLQEVRSSSRVNFKLLHRLIDGKPIHITAIDAPQALELRREPKANVARYDALRGKEVSRAS